MMAPRRTRASRFQSLATACFDGNAYMSILTCRFRDASTITGD